MPESAVAPAAEDFGPADGLGPADDFGLADGAPVAAGLGLADGAVATGGHRDRWRGDRSGAAVPAGGGDLAAVAARPGVVERDWRHGPAADRFLPVASPLVRLLPDGGLRRGATVGVEGSTSLLLALLAGPSLAGAWCGVVGVASLGALAGAERGVALDRLALVPDPGRDWPTVVAALLDAFEVVAVRPPAGARGSDARRLSARARERRAVLLALGPWEGADVRLTLTGGRWEGLGAGHGHLRARQVEVLAGGRGAASRRRRALLWLPALDGSAVGDAETPPSATGTPSPAVGPRIVVDLLRVPTAPALVEVG